MLRWTISSMALSAAASLPRSRRAFSASLLSRSSGASVERFLGMIRPLLQLRSLDPLRSFDPVRFGVQFLGNLFEHHAIHFVSRALSDVAAVCRAIAETLCISGHGR